MTGSTKPTYEELERFSENHKRWYEDVKADLKFIQEHAPDDLKKTLAKLRAVDADDEEVQTYSFDSVWHMGYRRGLRWLKDEREEHAAHVEELTRVRGLLQRQWISVEERLPRESGFYLIAFPWHFGDVVCEADYWEPTKVFRRHNGTHFALVTHWQPLPVPPNFRESSDLVPSGAESVQPEKLNTVHKSGAESSLSSPPPKVERDVFEVRQDAWYEENGK